MIVKLYLLLLRQTKTSNFSIAFDLKMLERNKLNLIVQTDCHHFLGEWQVLAIKDIDNYVGGKNTQISKNRSNRRDFIWQAALFYIFHFVGIFL